MTTMSPLRRRMIEDMTIRNLSPSTQQSYIYAVAKFGRHFGCSPDQLSLEQVRAYQLHLIEQKRSWSHINQVACALRFFYECHVEASGGIRANRRRSEARQASARTQRRGDRALSAGGCRIA
jgi:Phage integrase, N-terminal SAM-like domain